jgi:glycosyltransferase 2 family protein
MGSKAWIVVQAAVTVLLLAVLFRGLDIAALRALFAAVPPWYYLLSLLLILAGQVLYAWRWRLLLVANDIPVGLSNVVRQYFVGTFVNNFLPSTVGGDLAKVYYLGREHGYRPIAASVVLDRLLGIGLLALIASVTAWSVPLTSPALATARIVVTAIGAGAIAALTVAVYGTGGLQRRVDRLGPRFSQVAAHLRQFRVDMARAAARPTVLLQALAAILVYFLAVVALYQTFFRLMTPVAPPFVMLMAAVTMTSVLSNVPVSLNGLGLREQLHVALLQPLGVPGEAAVAISMLLYAHLLVVSVCGLVIWLRSPGMPAHAMAAPESERAEV